MEIRVNLWRRAVRLRRAERGAVIRINQLVVERREQYVHTWAQLERARPPANTAHLIVRRYTNYNWVILYRVTLRVQHPLRLTVGSVGGFNKAAGLSHLPLSSRWMTGWQKGLYYSSTKNYNTQFSQNSLKFYVQWIYCRTQRFDSIKIMWEDLLKRLVL